MNPEVIFLAIAHTRRSFVEASLVCALLELGAADAPSKTTSGSLRRRNLPESAFPTSTLHRVSARLASEGILSASVYKNTRTTYEVNAHWLDEALAAPGFDQSPSQNHRLVIAMHQLLDYDAALVLCRLVEVPADRLGTLKVAELIEPFGALMDRHRARRALYRLADRGLVALAPKERSGLGIALMAEAASELLARPSPSLRYLRPDAYASQPYFVARAARLASAGAAVEAVELGATESVASDVEARAGFPVPAAQPAAIADSGLSSYSN